MPSPIQVISLARSPERRRTFARDNPHLGYEFVDAVDGTRLTEAQMENKAHFVHPLAFPSMGAFGCALSHLKMWERAIERNEPVTVAEDDAVFRHDFQDRAAAFLAQLPPDWEFVLWGWNFNSILSVIVMPGVTPVVMVFDEGQLCLHMDAFQRMTAAPVSYGLDKCLGIPAYTISPSGARKFKEQCFPMRHFEEFFPLLNKNVPNTGVDIAMNRIYPVTRSLVAFPPLVATRNERKLSTVQD